LEPGIAAMRRANRRARSEQALEVAFADGWRYALDFVAARQSLRRTCWSRLGSAVRLAKPKQRISVLTEWGALREYSTPMVYMIVWSISRQNYKAAVARFKEDRALPAGLKLKARWHAMGGGEGFSLVETEDPVALSKYVAEWADLVDVRVVPIVDDVQMAQALFS
jgi:Domain of unknown function (DUF3303)